MSNVSDQDELIQSRCKSQLWMQLVSCLDAKQELAVLECSLIMPGSKSINEIMSHRDGKGFSIVSQPIWLIRSTDSKVMSMSQVPSSVCNMPDAAPCCLSGHQNTHHILLAIVNKTSSAASQLWQNYQQLVRKRAARDMTNRRTFHECTNLV